MSEFKKGDIIEVVDATKSGGDLLPGQLFEFKEYVIGGRYLIAVKKSGGVGISEMWFTKRFKLASRESIGPNPFWDLLRSNLELMEKKDHAK